MAQGAAYSEDMAGGDKPRDVVLLAGPTEDRKGIQVLRAREDRLEAGEVRPIEEGKPIHGEIATLTPRAQAPWICDVDVKYAPEKRAPEKRAPAARTGPAQVATDAYRVEYDRVFGGRGVN